MRVLDYRDGFYIQLRRGLGASVVAGPYQTVPIITREVNNQYGYFCDVKIGHLEAHVIMDPGGSEYLLTELDNTVVAMTSSSTGNIQNG